MKKMLCGVLIALCAFSMIGLTACGGEQTEGGGDSQSEGYVLEAEYVSLEGLISDTYSGSIGDVNLVYGEGTDAEKALGWSNGYYVGPTYDAGFTLNFVFTSDQDASAAITLRLGSDLGAIALNAANFSVKLNGTAINFGTLSVPKSDGGMAAIAFKDFQIVSNAQLKSGENTLSLTVLENLLWGGNKQGGPMVDCVKIKTTANIEYEEIDNPANR